MTISTWSVWFADGRIKPPRCKLQMAVFGSTCTGIGGAAALSSAKILTRCQAGFPGPPMEGECQRTPRLIKHTSLIGQPVRSSDGAAVIPERPYWLFIEIRRAFWHDWHSNIAT